MPKRHRVVRDYPDTWDAKKEGDHLGYIRNRFNIPFDVKVEFKHLKRRGLIRVTWKWSA